MRYDPQKVIDIALAEVGYLEKKTNSDLDSKTANAGYANYTKYARDLAVYPFYNGRKYGVAWCEVFVDWDFVQAYGKDAALALTCQPTKPGDNCGAGCESSFNYYKAKGQIYKDPQPGDQIFFWDKSKTTKSHTGLVYKVADGKVYTVEGNTSGASGVVANGGGVFKKSYSLSYNRIAGYGRPNWDIDVKGENRPVNVPDKKDEEVSISTETEANTGDLGGKKVIIELSTLRSGSKGAQVKTAQRLLNALGYNCGEIDGDFGSKTKTATIAFQKSKKLDADGIIGAKTWAALLK